MTEDLRARRNALIVELQEVEAELARASGGSLPPAPDELRRETLAPDESGHVQPVEQALEEQGGLFASVVAHAPDTIMVLDRERRIRLVNRLGLGFRNEDVIGQPAEMFVRPEQRERVRDAIQSVFDSGRPTAYETCVVAPDGEHWFYSRVGLIARGDGVERVSIISTEITERVLRERERVQEQDRLRESEARFRVLVEHAPEAVVILDVHTGQFVDCNPNACSMFGLSRQQLLEVGPLDVSPELQPDGRPSREVASEAIGRARAGEVVKFEWEHRNSAGASITVEVRLVKLPHAERELVRGSLTDIGERKRAEAEQQRLAAELLQAQKMQAIGQLTGGIAHDFNNLLTVIMSNVEMIDLDAQDEAQVRELSAQAMQATQRAAELTQRLLAFARRQPLRPRVLSMSRLVTGIERLLRRTLGEAIEIETVLGAGLWSCEADPAQLENVLLNLAINARDAMPYGGRLTIETGNARLDREYALVHDEVEPGQYVMLAVTDSGVGMSEAVLARAFEPFFTTKEVGRGSGLGLSTVYGFVKQSGGHIKIYSEPDVGTTVRIYLPRVMQDTMAREAGRAGGEPSGHNELVLVVEDADDVRALVVQMLQRVGYRTLQAPDATEALAVLSREPIQLLLTDVVLAGPMNGAELARRAVASDAGLRVLFMSGYTENAIIHNGRLDQGVSLIEKPFTRRELALAVAEALRQPRG